MMKRILMAIVMTCIFSSCAVVKEYEKVSINDPDMLLSEKKCDRNVVTVHSYREAAAGGNGGRTGGGCGCN